VTWLDRLASTPSAGVLLDPQHHASSRLLEAMRPIVDELFGDGRPTFTVDRHDSFSVAIGANVGYQFSVEPQKVFVDFAHKLEAKLAGAGPPVVRLTSEQRPYSELLPETIGRLVRLVGLVDAVSPRKVHRVGIISKTVVDEQEAPPGVLRFIKSISKPWPGGLSDYGIRIGANLSHSKGVRQRCIHNISVDDSNRVLKNTFIGTLSRSLDAHFASS